MEFGATYDYEGVAPYFQKRQQLSGKKGKFGEDIVGNSKDDFLQLLPIYSQGKPKTGRQFPDWKKQFIRTDNSNKIINHGLMHGLMKLSKKDSKIAIKNLNGIVVMKNTLQYIIKLFSSVHLECV